MRSIVLATALALAACATGGGLALDEAPEPRQRYAWSKWDAEVAPRPTPKGFFDGSSYVRGGAALFFDDARSSSAIFNGLQRAYVSGDRIYFSDGVSATRIGERTLFSNGLVATTWGDTVRFSDGRICWRRGADLVCI